MIPAVAELLREAEQLSSHERAELADYLVGKLVGEVAPDVEREQSREVQRRIVEVESGKVALIPGEQAFEPVRQAVGTARAMR